MTEDERSTISMLVRRYGIKKVAYWLGVDKTTVGCVIAGAARRGTILVVRGALPNLVAFAEQNPEVRRG